MTALQLQQLMLDSGQDDIVIPAEEKNELFNDIKELMRCKEVAVGVAPLPVRCTQTGSAQWAACEYYGYEE